LAVPIDRDAQSGKQRRGQLRFINHHLIWMQAQEQIQATYLQFLNHIFSICRVVRLSGTSSRDSTPMWSSSKPHCFSQKQLNPPAAKVCRFQSESQATES
jgi:hypothetical protein